MSEFFAVWEENIGSELAISLIVTLIEALLVFFYTRFRRIRKGTSNSLAWQFAYYVLFVLLLGLLLKFNSESFDRNEWATLFIFLCASLLFEGFLKWRAVHPQNRGYLRVMYNLFVIYACLRQLAMTFDVTEVLTILEFLALNIVYELMRQRGKREEENKIFYEINRTISRRKLRRLFSNNNIQVQNVNTILSRSFVHISAFMETQMVGFVNLIWSGDGPGEVDYLAVNQNVRGVREKLVQLVESEAKSAGISEIQITNKVVSQDDSLESALLENDYQRELCLVKQVRGDDMSTK